MDLTVQLYDNFIPTALRIRTKSLFMKSYLKRLGRQKTIWIEPCKRYQKKLETARSFQRPRDMLVVLILPLTGCPLKFKTPARTLNFTLILPCLKNWKTRLVFLL